MSDKPSGMCFPVWNDRALNHFRCALPTDREINPAILAAARALKVEAGQKWRNKATGKVVEICRVDRQLVNLVGRVAYRVAVYVVDGEERRWSIDHPRIQDPWHLFWDLVVGAGEST